MSRPNGDYSFEVGAVSAADIYIQTIIYKFAYKSNWLPPQNEQTKPNKIVVSWAQGATYGMVGICACYQPWKKAGQRPLPDAIYRDHRNVASIKCNKTTCFDRQMQATVYEAARGVNGIVKINVTSKRAKKKRGAQLPGGGASSKT